MNIFYNSPASRIVLGVALVLISPVFSFAQIQHGGQPLGWGEPWDQNLTWNTFESLDLEALAAEDAVTATIVAWPSTN